MNTQQMKNAIIVCQREIVRNEILMADVLAKKPVAKYNNMEDLRSYQNDLQSDLIFLQAELELIQDLEMI